MSTEEKTEQATDHKLREARKKGQISKSMDVTAMAGIAVCLITIMVVAEQIGRKMMAATERIFLLAPEITPSALHLADWASVSGLPVSSDACASHDNHCWCDVQPFANEREFKYIPAEA